MNNKNLIYILSIVCIITIILPFLFTRSAFCDSLIFSGTGEIGDTIGGITAPVIGLLNAFLLYLTIKEQYAFNKEQHIFNEKQKKDSFDAQFKDTFFALLQNQLNVVTKLHAEFSYIERGVIKKIEKKEYHVFKSCLKELQFLYKSFEHSCYEGKFILINDEINMEKELGIFSPIYELKEYNHTYEKYVTKYTNLHYDISEEIYLQYKQYSQKDKISLLYRFFFYKYEVIGVYFRHLYNILKYIDFSEEEAIKKFAHTSEEKQDIKNQYKQYAQFIQAQMSREELCLLFYNSFLFEKMQKLIIKYNLLENLTIESLITPEHNCIKEMNLKSKIDTFQGVC